MTMKKGEKRRQNVVRANELVYMMNRTSNPNENAPGDNP